MSEEVLQGLFDETLFALGDEEADLLAEQLSSLTEPAQHTLEELIYTADADCGAVAACLEPKRASAERWGRAVGSHECSSNCLGELAHNNPDLLDLVRQRLEAARVSEAESKERYGVVPLRKLTKMRHREDAAVQSALQRQVELDLAADLAARACETPSAAAEYAWLALLAAGCCIKGVQAVLNGYEGRSLQYHYHARSRQQGSSRAPGIDEKRAGAHLDAPEEVVGRRCCDADCSPLLTTGARSPAPPPPPPPPPPPSLLAPCVPV